MSSGAMYPGTFDPITNGHADIVRRSAKMFDRVVVAVAASPSKEPMFTLDERIELAQEALAGIDNVSVEGYQELTVEFAIRNKLGVIVRGLRAITDFEFEFQLASMNRNLEASVETVFLTPSDDYYFLSSSLVREIAVLGGDVSKFLHPAVVKALAPHRKK